MTVIELYVPISSCPIQLSHFFSLLAPSTHEHTLFDRCTRGHLTVYSQCNERDSHFGVRLVRDETLLTFC